MKSLLILFAMASLSGPVAWAEASKKPKEVREVSYESYVMCRSLSLARTIRVSHGPRGCVTKYQRDGAEKVVATAQSLGICQDVKNKIQKNLMENKWDCRDLTSSQVSSAE